MASERFPAVSTGSSRLEQTARDGVTLWRTSDAAMLRMRLLSVDFLDLVSVSRNPGNSWFGWLLSNWRAVALNSSLKSWEIIFRL